jgi:N,N'-diacetyllegionaminate synthase
VAKVFFIAEAGVNHNGSIDKALKLCDAAKQAGADAVKFQTFRTECNVLKDCDWVEYQKENAGECDSHWEMLKSLELTDDEFRTLKKHCETIRIKFLSTPSDAPSLDLLSSMDMDIIKISSGDVTNIPLLRKIAKLQKPVIMSTGMSSVSEIQAAMDILLAGGISLEDITLLHCHSDYPTSFENANISVMKTLEKTFGTKTGLSDHTVGPEASIAAVAIGAVVIEKHLTLDKNMEGPDHKASADPAEMAAIIRAVRNTEKAMGDGVKRITEAEKKIRDVYGKGIVAAKLIKKGEEFSEDNLAVKRPCKGISVLDWDKVIGRVSNYDFKENDAIKL